MEPKPEIDRLPEALGYAETKELAELRRQVVDAMLSGAGVTELLTRYQLLGEQVVLESQRSGGDSARTQIGLMVQMALVRRDGGNFEGYWDGLDEAMRDAEQQEGLEVVVADLLRVLEDEAKRWDTS